MRHLHRWLAIGALLAAAAPGTAAAQSYPLRLQDGATWHATFERASSPEQVTVRFTRRLTWSSAGAGGRLLVEPVSADVLAPPGEDAAQLVPDFAYALEVDAGLRPVALIDKAEVIAATRRWLLRQPRMAQALPTLEARAPNLVELTAWALAAQELILLGQSQGLSFGPEGSLRRQGEIQNPLGGSPMSGTDTFTLEPFDPRTGKAVVSFRRDPDQASFRASITSMIRAMAQRDGRAIPPGVLDQLLATAVLDLSFTCRHELDPVSGLALRAGCVRSFRAEIGGTARQKEERWTLTQERPGPAR